jgi:hypothetical protein
LLADDSAASTAATPAAAAPRVATEEVGPANLYDAAAITAASPYRVAAVVGRGPFDHN